MNIPIWTDIFKSVIAGNTRLPPREIVELSDRLYKVYKYKTEIKPSTTFILDGSLLTLPTKTELMDAGKGHTGYIKVELINLDIQLIIQWLSTLGAVAVSEEDNIQIPSGISYAWEKYLFCIKE